MKTPLWMIQGIALGAYLFGMCLGLAEHCLGKLLGTTLIETLYLRYVWPQKMPKEWTPEAQMESLRMDAAEFFRGHWKVGMALDSCGPLGQMLADLVRMLLTAGSKDGKPAPNYCEAQIMLDHWAKLEGDLAERVTLTVQRCKGQTPHEMKAAAEAELRQQQLANNELRAECTRLSEEIKQWRIGNAQLSSECVRHGEALDNFRGELARAFDPSGDTDCDEETLLRAASMTNELRERAEKAEQQLDVKERLHQEKLAAVTRELSIERGACNSAGAWVGELKTETGALFSIVWHFATRANLTVADAMKSLTPEQREKVQAIWRAFTAGPTEEKP